jgi:hypothetical protein
MAAPHLLSYHRIPRLERQRRLAMRLRLIGMSFAAPQPTWGTTFLVPLDPGTPAFINPRQGNSAAARSNIVSATRFFEGHLSFPGEA